MMRPLRFVYPGAVYHIMASGDGGKAIREGFKILDLQDQVGATTSGLAAVRKGDPRMEALASVVKTRTCLGNAWLVRRLEMGHDHSVSRLIRKRTLDPGTKKLCAKLKKMLPCEN